MSESITGYIDHIIFRNEDNGYTVMVLKGVSEEDELTCVGSFPVVTQGASVELEGNFTQHPVYGKQFQAVRLTEKMPEDALAMERYLGSGAIKGIGAALAGRIVRHFGDDTFQIVENEPERLSEVKGISEKKAREIAMQIAEKSAMKEFLKKELYSFRAVAAILARWLLLAVPTGLVCGAVGTAFHLAVEHVTEWRAEHIWLLWLLPVAGLAIVALYKVTGCEGMGTNNVIRAVHSGESVSPLLVPAIFFGTVLTHLCGGSAGREGAALQMGGSIGYNIAKLFRFSDHDRRTATACGMAAFFSALFGTPLSATLFGIMVEDVGLAFSVAFVPGFAAALIAYGVSLACGISPTHFELTAPALSIDSTLLVAVLGVACALVARAFCWLLHTMEHEMPRRLPNPWVRAVVGGAAVVALSYLMGVGRYNGAGMGVITAAVEQGQALPWDFICKILLTALTLSAGFKGGEVVPSFYIGATFGCAFGPLLGLPAGFSAAVGLVSVFCGATNTLIPSILLAYELFGGVGLELIALGCGVCYMLSGTHGLYSSQLFVTEKLLSEYTESWGKRLRK